jgi:hypothetical protein
MNARTAIVALLLVVMAPAAAWEPVDPPPQATLQWVAEDMNYNGVPMRIQFFRSNLALPALLEHYRQRWSEGGKRRYVENDLGPWKVISHEQGDYFIAVQVRPATDRGSEGYLSQRPTHARPKASLGDGFPFPPGSEVVNDILTRDPDRSARTLLAFNGLTVDANADFYRTRLTREGWAIADDAKGRNGGRQLVLRGPAGELSLALAGGPRTAVAATLVRK